jgi:hypothetical protein
MTSEGFYDLRLYFVVQGSLFFTLVLAGAVAFCWANSWRCFGWLAAGSFAHLLLDATQIKWANGVVLGAPFSWQSVRFDLFWPESRWSDAMTVLGAFVLVFWAWRLMVRARPSSGPPLHSGSGVLHHWSATRAVGSGALCLVYLTGPLLFLSATERAGAHSISVLRHSEVRVGRVVELHQASHGVDDQGAWVRTLSEEVLRLEELPPELVAWPGRLSLRARFVDPNTLEVLEAHGHRRSVRVVASLIGLTGAGLLVILAAWRRVGGEEEPAAPRGGAAGPRVISGTGRLAEEE